MNTWNTTNTTKPVQAKTDSWRWAIIFIIALQMCVYSIRLTDPFVDGRFHVNWGPPFWLIKAQMMHKVNFFHAYLGAVSGIEETPHGLQAGGWYTSHPQFIAIPLYVWTGIFGFHEWAARSLVACVTILTSVLLWYALRARHTGREAFIFLLVWSLLPMMVTFGSKLDQEPFVMFFLALAFFAHERFIKNPRGFPWLWTIAVFGMLWSDWSGFVFAGLFFVAFLCVSRVYKPARALWWGTFVGGGVGALLVLGQIFVEVHSRHEAVGGVVAGFTSLYQYRSGTTYPNFWYLWVRHQFEFFWTNYAWGVGYAAAVAVFATVWSTLKARAVAFRNGLSLVHLCAISALGTFVYAVIVPQATIIHIYYQYFYSLAVAYGAMIIFEWVRAYTARTHTAAPLAPIFLIAALFVSAYASQDALYSDRINGWGAPADMVFFQKIRSMPHDATVVVVSSASITAWIDNPNIQYYAGRSIPVQAPDVPNLDADFVIVESVDMAGKIKFLNEKAARKPFHYEPGECSPHFCLLQRAQ